YQQLAAILAPEGIDDIDRRPRLHWPNGRCSPLMATCHTCRDRSMVVSMHRQTAPDNATHGGEPRLLSVDDVGRTLGGITRRYVYRMIESGELESVKLGRRRLVPADA